MLVTTRNLVPGPPCAYVTVGRDGRIASPARLCYLREQCPAWGHLEDPVLTAVVFKRSPRGGARTHFSVSTLATPFAYAMNSKLPTIQ